MRLTYQRNLKSQGVATLIALRRSGTLSGMADSAIPSPRVGLTPLLTADVERMTSLSAAAQRVWRNRGHLDALNGTRARFDVRDVAAISIRYELACFGFPPAETMEIGRRSSPSVLYFLLMNSSGVCEALAQDNKSLDEFEELFDRDDDLIRAIVGLNQNRDPTKYLFKPSRLDFRTEVDLNQAQSLTKSRSAVYVDVEAVAEQIGWRAGRPLITLFLGDASRDTDPPSLIRVLNRR